MACLEYKIKRKQKNKKNKKKSILKEKKNKIFQNNENNTKEIKKVKDEKMKIFEIKKNKNNLNKVKKEIKKKKLKKKKEKKINIELENTNNTNSEKCSNIIENSLNDLKGKSNDTKKDSKINSLNELKNDSETSIEKFENEKKIEVKSHEENTQETFYSEVKFEDLDICDALKKGLKDLNFVKLTEIQAKCIPHFLNGKDILGAAKTGSGKTLAFLIPSIHILYNIKFLPKNGTGVLIISPTRELCLQIYQVCKDLCKYIPQTNGIIIGGMSRNEEKKKFVHGINILIATPGRLLDHMQNTKEFVYKNLICLIIDEADRLLQIGFEEEINLIIKRLPKKRQTALFSATQTTKVESLIRLSLQKPIFIEVTTKIATVERLQQGYALVEEDKRFLLLFTFLKRNLSKKIMVFFNNCMSVQFYNDLLNYIDIPTYCIHGKKKQNKRLKSFHDFSSAQSGILLCTNVAARGLDIPNVNYIIQYDPPDDSKEYIHRVGRTCRGNNSNGSAIIFLMEHELKFLNYLKFYNIPINQFAYDTNKIINIQSHIQSIVTKNFHLHKMAREAFKAYLNSYITYALKDVFDVNNLNLLLASKNFGLEVPPKVDLNLKLNIKKKKFK
ncbi:ATP-dependent RNA helicase HAS1, putative [Plasmodium gallinaceum]|uniref:ATP-dependent RNA helicase n=1 Tax=Plasmodium gallinaceum TaxID=5849 RepID=A0A1J1GN50_PLAGA|nr:ATP-dependent RNA helicase HAS1, putative [Plasmodium gallinaceum]CRG93887.1 ATP-dependent RNA helicase HAS1, putative [Plasmodium gallinaceum]